jgi:hypothetical protein
VLLCGIVFPSVCVPDVSVGVVVSLLRLFMLLCLVRQLMFFELGFVYLYPMGLLMLLCSMSCVMSGVRGPLILQLCLLSMDQQIRAINFSHGISED